MTLNIKRRYLVIAGIILLVAIAMYGAGRADAPTATIEPTPTVEPTVEPTEEPTPTPTPTPTPVPVSGTPFLIWTSHVLVTINDIVSALDGMDTEDPAAMGIAAGDVADIADAEQIWLLTVEPQACYQAEYDSYRTMIEAVSVGYRAAQTAILSLDLDGLNAAIVLIGHSNDLIDETSLAMDASTC